jgi:acyl-CoA thioester hydrolase
MSLPAPFVSDPMDMTNYNVLFDHCADIALDAVSMGLGYVKERRLTIYTAEAHICYVQELHLDHKVTVSFQLLERRVNLTNS